MYKKILVPLDGSPLAEAALPPVVELAQCTGAKIILLRVLLTPVYEYMRTDPVVATVTAEAREINRDEVQNYLEYMAAGLRQKGLTVETQVCEGPIADAILDYAESIHTDLIAMSTHGRSGLARWLIGSVADKVVHAATMPVLLVRPRLPKNA